MAILKLKYSVSFLIRILNISLFIFFVNLLLFASFLINDIFLDTNISGDITKYLGDLLKANNLGLSTAISDGTSIPYLIITYFVDKIIKNPLLSLKLTSLTIGVIMILSIYTFNSKIIKVNSPIKVSLFFWIIYLFVIQTTIFSGVNDILLDFFGTLFFIILFLEFKNQVIKIILIGILLALMLATRKMAFTYIFVFFLMSILFGVLIRDRIFNFKNFILIFLSFSFFFILLNFYPLIKHQKFSFDDKILQGPVNWAQWDYHNSLLIDQGVQERFQHVNIRETEKYLTRYGENSLPKSFFEMIIFNPRLTIKEFFIDSAIGLKYIFRQTGLLIFPFIFFLFFRINNVFKEKYITATDFIYLFCFSYFFIISFVVIANIQARWFMFFMPIMILLIGKDLNKMTRNKQILFSISNNLLLTIMCFQYLFEKLNELF